MPITKSAKKALRSSLKKRSFNDKRRRAMRDVLKQIKKSSSTDQAKDALALIPEAYKAIDKATKHGVIKKNTASRKKSRLTLSLNKISK
jgi:small subunit ribosomal protein S20